MSALKGSFMVMRNGLGEDAQIVIELTVEVEGCTKPACVAESISRRYT